MSSSTTSKVALITGGTRGIGRAIAETLYADGLSVAVTGTSDQNLQSVADALPGVLTLKADASDPTQAEGAVAEVVAHFGALDILVNNAGIAGGGPTWEVDEADWWRIIEVNLRGPYLYSRAVIPHMLERNAGVVINVSSGVCRAPTAGFSAYGASKTALTHFSSSLDEELADTGISVFCVSPGLVETDMKDIPKELWSPPEKICAMIQLLLTGDYDALGGRFIHVTDNLQNMLENAQQIQDEELYQLRIRTLDE